MHYPSRVSFDKREISKFDDKNRKQSESRRFDGQPKRKGKQ